MWHQWGIHSRILNLLVMAFGSWLVTPVLLKGQDPIFGQIGLAFSNCPTYICAISHSTLIHA